MKIIIEFKEFCFTLVILGVILNFFKLGKISQIRRNKNWVDFVFLRVTLTPQGAPFLIFKKTDDFLARKK